MQTIYRIHADELTDDFLQALKITYKDREINIIVSDDVDETDYLMSSPANRDHLLRAVDNINNHKNLIEISSDDL